MIARRAALLSALLVLAPASQLAAQAGTVSSRIRENQERLEAIRRERAELQAELNRLQGTMHSITSELENIDRQRNVTTRIVNELDRQIRSMNSELDTVTFDVVLAEDALAEKQAVLERRLVEIYKRGSLWMFQVLLAAESFGDLISRYKYLYLVSRQDRALLRSVEELRGRVVRRRTDLVSVSTELGRQRADRGRELDRFLSLEQRRQRALREAQASQRRTTTRLDSLARDEERLNSVIANLERERRRAGSATGPSSISESSLGSLDWPVDGDVVYRYGPQQGPGRTTVRRHGIGIAAPVGTPVRAVAGGTVQHAGPFGTYGPTVLIDHGNGYYTLYLYLARTDVRVGQTVASGAVIGRSGGATTETGPHIEFQIRGQGGIALDPESWLKRK